MCAPVMMSFASIIFADPFFAPYAPELVKLVLFSSAVHQLCYVKWSTMPFAVGQVQDAGLIFLSSMARFVVADGQSHADDHGTTMAAALWTLGLATALLGVMLIVIGRLRLASLAQYLPVPVVGGYLAYIGFYCGQAGLAMMSGVEVTHLRAWPKLFRGSGPAKMCVGVVVAAAIVCTSSIAEKRKWSRASKSLIMPCVLVATCVIFYFVLYVEGSTLAESREHGWVGALPALSEKGGTGWRNVPILRPWALYAPRNTNEVLRAVGRVAPRLIPSWLAMVCVVAFSSSLDVAAVEMELGSPLNYDSELQTAVWKSKFYGAFVLNHHVVLHAIDATHVRWRGNAGSSPLDRARTAASSPRNDLVKNCRVHPTHWLISTQADGRSREPGFWLVRRLLW